MHYVVHSRAKHAAAAKAAHQQGLKQQQQSHNSRHAAALQAEYFTAKSTLHGTGVCIYMHVWYAVCYYSYTIVLTLLTRLCSRVLFNEVIAVLFVSYQDCSAATKLHMSRRRCDVTT
jgi:hypothetical protein